MKPAIKSEYGKLKKVLVHTPGAEHRQLIPWDGDHPLMGNDPRAFLQLQKNHGDLKQFLEEEAGKENVYELSDLLVDIFDQADERKRYTILREILENLADNYVDHLQARGRPLATYDSSKLVKDLIHGYPRKLTLNNGLLPNLIIPPKRELMWMRDSAATTPAGVVINAMASNRRMHEPALVRTAFQHHPMFDEDSIFLDLVDVNRKMRDDITRSGLNDRYLLEGGNILVLSEDTLAIGVGKDHFLYNNRTNRKAFYLLVQKLLEADKSKKIKRVYMVNVPDLRSFIHLDTVFNQFAPQSAIAMPYVFGYPKPALNMSPKDVLQKFVRWLRQDMGKLQTDLSRIPSEEHFEYAGKCEVYDRDYIEQKGEVVPLPQAAKYFFDQLIEDGLLDLNKVVWIGGSPDNFVNEFDHLKVALFEQANMAGNIFTTGPNRAVAYHRNPTTLEALRNKMAEADSENSFLSEMTSNELRTDNGGPHCLTMPLEREE
ncbi:MAG: arginine deiminase family protein [Bacteroidia bacterium]